MRATVRSDGAAWSAGARHRVWPRVARRSTLAAVLAVGVIGGTAALAQSDSADTGATPSELLAELDDIEQRLPEDGPVSGVELFATETWGSLEGDATSARAELDTVEPDLRALFIDADGSEGDVADAVALVARGWLDLWLAADAISAAEAHDLAFPIDTTDGDDVATGADDLRGAIEIGVELVLDGRERLHDGYLELRELGEAEPDAQARLDERADAAEVYDAEVRPRLVLLRSQPTSTVAIPVERFVTDAPGAEARATSLEVICVDRERLEEFDSVASDEALTELEEIERVDCPSLPPELAD